MFRPALITLTLAYTCIACERQEQTKEDKPRAVVQEKLEEGDIPSVVEEIDRDVPLHFPVHRDAPQLAHLIPELLQHPWVQEQPQVEWVTEAMVRDIQSVLALNARAESWRHARGLPSVSWQEESQALMHAIQTLQAPLRHLEISYPAHAYSTLNIPSVDPHIYKTPVPFQVHKRVILGQSTGGFPVTLDTRIFRCEPSQVKEIIQWHLKTLSAGEEAFKTWVAGEWTIHLGRGDRDPVHFDNSHGFYLEDRGVFFAHRFFGDRLVVLCVDALWTDIEPQVCHLHQLFPSPWAEI